MPNGILSPKLDPNDVNVDVDGFVVVVDISFTEKPSKGVTMQGVEEEEAKGSASMSSGDRETENQEPKEDTVSEAMVIIT